MEIKVEIPIKVIIGYDIEVLPDNIKERIKNVLLNHFKENRVNISLYECDLYGETPKITITN